MRYPRSFLATTGVAVLSVCVLANRYLGLDACLGLHVWHVRHRVALTHCPKVKEPRRSSWQQLWQSGQRC